MPLVLAETVLCRKSQPEKSTRHVPVLGESFERDRKKPTASMVKPTAYKVTLAAQRNRPC
jgi:hypothetical protein